MDLEVDLAVLHFLNRRTRGEIDDFVNSLSGSMQTRLVRITIMHEIEVFLNFYQSHDIITWAKAVGAEDVVELVERKRYELRN